MNHLITYAQTLSTKAHALAAEMSTATANARALAIHATRIGYHLGEVLTEARTEYQQGTFAVLLADIGISQPQALKLCRLAKEYTLAELTSRAGPQRQGFFALDLVPEKERVIHPDDGSFVVSPGIGTCVGAWRKFMYAVQCGRAVLNEEQAREQTKELLAWLLALHGRQ